MTLIEVILGLAIFSIAAISLTQSFIDGMNLMDRLRKPSPSQWEEEFVLNAILLTETEEQIERGDDIKTFDGNTISWEGELEETEIPDLHILTATIESKSSADKTSFPATIRRYLFRPSWSEQTQRSEALEEFKKNLEDERAKMSHYP